MKGLRRDQRGFTLIETMIVVIMIAILALIVIPRLLGANRRSRESALLGDLHQLRSAIQQFQADTGACPPALSDLMVASGAAISADADGAGMSVDRGGYKGPYLRTGDGNLPADPFTRAVDWNYDNVTGDIHSACAMTTVDGSSSYDTW